MVMLICTDLRDSLIYLQYTSTIVETRFINVLSWFVNRLQKRRFCSQPVCLYLFIYLTANPSIDDFLLRSLFQRNKHEKLWKLYYLRLIHWHIDRKQSFTLRFYMFVSSMLHVCLIDLRQSVSTLAMFLKSMFEHKTYWFIWGGVANLLIFVLFFTPRNKALDTWLSLKFKKMISLEEKIGKRT